MGTESKEIKDAVRKRYAQAAKQASCCSPNEALTTLTSSCCPSAATPVKGHSGRLYSTEELQAVPQEARQVSLGCGNPVALAQIKPGQTILDLGSGGGIDCFLAVERVGLQGKVIGLDMTPEMIKLARENAQKMGLANVEFRLGEMEHMPVEDSTVDLIISNCVVCLSPDKDAVFREAFRVLRPGGKLCLSDMVFLGEIPIQVKDDAEKWVHCVAGALEKDDYLRRIAGAGFADIITNKLERREARPGEEWRSKMASLTVTAVKPAL
ncbi:MAG: arsM [Dehalococcoidia bacterium]|nr:arsM [Dehalococcoidia bacterium]